MHILCIDPSGEALDWCLRCINAGHKVMWWMRNVKENEFIGQGLVPRVPDWKDHIEHVDMVFLPDNTHWLRDIDGYRDRVPIFGPTSDMAELELDRVFGQEVLKEHGIETLPYEVFENYDDAISYVKQRMERLVSKPIEDQSDKALSYCAKTPEDMVYMLQRWKEKGSLKGSFMLQDFVEGCEMAVGGWFGPGGFNKGWCENFEFKKLMTDDIGVATGEQGTVLRYVAKSKLADKVLAPLSDYLEKENYSGYIDVNCIIDEDGNPWPLEFTARPGWPTFNIQQSLLIGDPAEWMMATLEGYDPRNWEMDQVAVGVVLTIPDYPFTHKTQKEVCGVPIYGLTPAIAPQVHPLRVMMGDGPVQAKGSIVMAPMYVTAGDYVLATTGVGQTVLQAKKDAYRVLERIRLPNSPQYRTDIGDRLRKQLPICQKHGYATGMVWDFPRD